MGNAVLTWSVTAWEAVVSEYIAQSGEPLPDNIRVSVSNEGSALSTGDFSPLRVFQAHAAVFGCDLLSVVEKVRCSCDLSQRPKAKANVFF